MTSWSCIGSACAVSFRPSASLRMWPSRVDEDQMPLGIGQGSSSCMFDDGRWYTRMHIQSRNQSISAGPSQPGADARFTHDEDIPDQGRQYAGSDQALVAGRRLKPWIIGCQARVILTFRAFETALADLICAFPIFPGRRRFSSFHRVMKYRA